MSWFLLNRNLTPLEPYDWKLSRTVLRGERGSNAPDLPGIETEESAITSTLRKLSAYVGGYCNRKYPIYGTILESARQSKDKQKEVYIDLGTNLGAYKGLHLTAYTVKTIAGKEAKIQVGKLKIMDVQGEDISFCKIQSGGKEIKNILDKGETIFVKSTE